ncbi:MAG: YkgJ family cysteine cluster protein [Kiritimatiellia bacterium]
MKLPFPADFACRRCGRCCRVPGEVSLQPNEVDAIARLLGLEPQEFIDHHTRLNHDRSALALLEEPDGRCAWLDTDERCRIQNAKPKQCRDFPVWTTPDLEAACPALAMNKPHIYEPIVRPRVWGVETILLSALDQAPSREIGTGVSLPDLLAAQPNLLGAELPFPLLFKHLHTTDVLSVQVHPNEATAPLTGGDPKTEMWFILRGTRSDAILYAGLAPDANPGQLASPEAGRALVRHHPAPGDTLLIPGGLVHAIGPGCDIYEVQQASDTTFRLYDWNRPPRPDAPRPLHTKQALQAIDWHLPPPRLQPLAPIHTRHFTTEIHTLPCHIPQHATFQVLFTQDSGVTLLWGGNETPLPPCHCCLVPARMALSAAGAGSLVRTIIP